MFKEREVLLCPKCQQKLYAGESHTWIDAEFGQTVELLRGQVEIVREDGKPMVGRSYASGLRFRFNCFREDCELRHQPLVLGLRCHTDFGVEVGWFIERDDGKLQPIEVAK